MVAGLLSVAEHPAQQGAQGGNQENERQGVLVVEDGENAHAAQHWDQSGGDEAQHAQGDGQKHHSGEGPYQRDEAGHTG